MTEVPTGPGDHPSREDSMQNEQAQQLQCEMCSKTLKSSARLSRHLKIVHECDVCGLKFSSKGEHYKKVHPEKFGKSSRLTKCNTCSEEFKNVIRLKRHLKAVHQKYLYRCTDCNLNMDSLRLYRAHNVLLHPEKKGPGPRQPKMTFDCCICAEELRGFISLRRHMKTVHQKRLYRCKDCDQIMATRLAMK